MRAADGVTLELARRLEGPWRVFVRGELAHLQAQLGASDVLADGRAVAAVARGAAMAPLDLGDGLWGTVSAGVAYDTRGADRLGSYLALTSALSAPLDAPHSRVARLRLEAESARPLGPFVLRLQGHAGVARGVDGELPLTARLFHGGNSDVRGYAVGAFGAPQGDGAELVGRAELELPIWRRAGLSVAAFADVGVRGALDGAAAMGGAGWARSAGGSLIWRSPIGTLRVDVAYPLDGNDRRPVFLFSLGEW